MSKLKVTQIRIRDVLGIRELAIEPGQVTILSGKNATGKTSTLEAIKSAVCGGDLSKLSRIDDEDVEPETVLVLDGDDGQVRVKKSLRGTEVKKQVGNSQAFEKQGKPQFWLDGLYDGKLSNPLKFLEAKNKERVLWLLDALDVQLDRDALWSQMGLDRTDVDIPIPSGLHPLQELSWIRDAVFNKRTGVNHDAKAKANSCEQIRRNTPAVLPEGHDERIAELDAETRETEGFISTEILAAKESARARADKATQEAAAEIDKVWMEHKIFENKVMMEAREKIEKNREKSAKNAVAAGERAEQVKTAAEKERDKKIESLRNQQLDLEGRKSLLKDLRRERDESIKARTLHEEANKQEQAAQELREHSERLTAALQALDAYRRSLADDLPIPGLEVDGDQITIDGIPFDKTNTAKQIEIAVKLACLRSKGKALPIIWVDRAEGLDQENLDLLCEAIAAEGVQAFVGYRNDDPFKVETR